MLCFFGNMLFFSYACLCSGRKKMHISYSEILFTYTIQQSTIINSKILNIISQKFFIFIEKKTFATKVLHKDINFHSSAHGFWI